MQGYYVADYGCKASWGTVKDVATVITAWGNRNEKVPYVLGNNSMLQCHEKY